ncbi:MAG: DUF6273 domain-containing protein [Clostridiales Family XIII bacterium]|jgi:hypothetical protein|nr:DUF6273 domain-containing protein [Clostridiales Family XIII bacterium]
MQENTIVVGGIIPFGAFGGKALCWRVLDVDVQNGRALLLTEDIIEKRSYHSSYTDVTWEECALRRYLNGDFLTDFGTDKSRIAQVTNANPDNPWYGTAGGDSTTDKVFLLSIDEAVKYFGDSGDLKNRKGWYYENGKDVLKDGKGWWINDQYNSKRIAKYENRTWWWWLRSPGGHSDRAAGVDDDGSLSVIGDYVHHSECGVRPALWLNLELNLTAAGRSKYV